MSSDNSQTPTLIGEQYEFPVSFAQQRIWFLDQLEGPGAAYNVKLPVRLSGAIDPECLQRAIDYVVDRHESLRTTFAARHGTPVQIVSSSMGVPLLTQEMSDATPERLQQKVGELALHEFSLDQGPLLRVDLLVLDDDEHLLVMIMHHIIGDAWSSGVLFHDLARAYDAIVSGETPALPELPVQYADFAVWQRDWLEGSELDRQADYWQRQLAGAPGLLEWPADRPRPRRQTFSGGKVLRALSADLTAALKDVAQSQSCTLFMVMLAAFDVLVARYTGNEDTVVGTPIAGRQRTEVEGLVGLFVNTLVMRVDVGGNPTFAELLARVRAVSIDAFSNQELPFEKLVEILQPARDMSHTPLFQTMFVLQNTPWEAQPIRGVTVSPGETSPGETAKFDLTWSANEFEGELWLSVEYNSDLFDFETIERLVAVYANMLAAIVENPAIETVSLAAALDPSDLRRLADWNETSMSYDPDVTVVERVLDQARRTPDAVAIEHAGGRMTYAKLAARVESIAEKLREVLPSNETCIAAILVDRSPAMVAAVFGAMRAGAAYLPLDPQYPAERIEHMLDDSGSAILITSETEGEALPAFSGTLVVVDDMGLVKHVRRGNVDDIRGVDAGTAYVIYTSGSTGLPKGVCIPHPALANFMGSMAREPGILPDDRLLAVTTLSFDIAALELMLPLTAGGTVIVASTETSADGRALANMIDACEPSVMQATPSTWRMLLSAGWQGRPGMKILCGGESMDLALAEQLLAAGHDLWNMYGPTETTIWSTCVRIAATDAPITVGRPIGNTRIYVLDGRMRRVPIGVAGELCIGGDGLADGYHRRPELTDERFVIDPFMNDGGRLYRTGDRARWRRDGTIELLGRMDRQVKLRGFRIELGEIEAALTSVSGIETVVVVLDEVSSGDTRIVAYVVPDTPADGLDTVELRNRVRQGLPDYMVPSLIVAIPSVPLTLNGKLDRRALPPPDWTSVGADGLVAPRDAIETALAGLFAEVLGRAAVGVHDSFFDLGGHSLLATRLVARIRDAFAAEVPLRALFEAPTVAGLAVLLQSDDAEQLARELEHGRHQLRPRAEDHRHEVPASFVQQRMWFLDRLEPGIPVYNLVWSMRVSGELQVATLEQAVASVVMRHETLRTTIVGIDGEAMQRIADESHVPVVVESIDSGAALDARLAAIARRPFDLASGPLLRVHALQTGEREHVLVLVIHHIVADGWSMAVLFDELAHGYNAYRAGRAPEWSPLAVQYADYALWQRGWLAGAELARQLGYWREQLDGAPSQLQLPTDRPRLPVQRHRGARMTRRVPADVLEDLQLLGRDSGCTLFMVLLAAFDAVLARYSGQADVVVGTPIAGRGRTELEGLIGFFVNTLVLRADLDGDPRFEELLARVKHTALDAYAHQDVPFEKIVDELKPERDAGRTPVFQVMFNLHNEPAEALRLDGVDVSSFGVERNTSKFDLSVSLSESNDGLYAQFEYDTDLFDAETVAGLSDYYVQVLAAVVATPSLRLSALPAAPSRAVGRPAAGTPVAGTDLVAAFAARVAAAPKRAAVLGADESAGNVSYGALDAQANRLGWRLHALALTADAHVPRVGLLVAQDRQLVTGLLGILKAGCAWVPLEPSQPPARLAAMAADAGITAVVTDAAHAAQARALFGSLPVLDLDAPGGEPTAPSVTIEAAALAYIIYTSGTTGTPKGVLQTHAGAVAQVRRYAQSLGLQPDDRLSLLSGYGYDAAVQDVFGALLTGAAVCPLDVRNTAAPATLVERLVGAGITVVHATPTVYRHLFGGELNCDHDLSAVRALVLGGEVARRSDFELYRSRFARGTLFINGFGLTESTMGLQWYADHDTRVLGQQLPIGAAVAGVEVALVDAGGRPGWHGEIRLRGDGVFAGYWKRPDARRTAEGWYCTGDVGRRLPDGQVVYVGRRDEQLKIRGQRVEPGEIEAALGGLAGVAECAVRRVERPGEDWLVAYVVAPDVEVDGATGQLDAWRAALGEVLPRYMVPQAFERVDALPRRANGKVALEMLPAPGAPMRRAAVPPRTELEAVLTGLWRDVLQVETLGIHDDFFALGGHSLLATRLVSRIRDRLGVEVPLVSLFENTTVAGLADTIEDGSSTNDATLVQAAQRHDLASRQNSAG